MIIKLIYKMDTMLFERTQTEKQRQELYDFNLFQLVPVDCWWRGS